MGLFAHPVVIGPLVGLLIGDVGIGTIVGVALASAFEAHEPDQERAGSGAGIAAASGTAVAGWLSDRGGMGGLLVESFAGALLALLWCSLLGGVWRAARRRHERTAVLGQGLSPQALRSSLRRFHLFDIGAVAAAVFTVTLAAGATGAWLWANASEAVRAFAPWWSGVVLCVGLGRMMGSRHPRQSGDRPPRQSSSWTVEGATVPTSVGLRALLAEGAEPRSALARASWIFALDPVLGPLGAPGAAIRSRLLDLPLRAHSAALPAVLGASAALVRAERLEDAEKALAEYASTETFVDARFWDELRSVVIIGGLLVLNVVGPVAMWAVLLGLAAFDLFVRLVGFRAGARSGPAGVEDLLNLPWRRWALLLRGALLLCAIPAALFVVWLPYQLPSQDRCAFPLPLSTVEVAPTWAVAFKMIPLLLATSLPAWSTLRTSALAWVLMSLLAVALA